MKKVFIILILVVVIQGCKSEEDVGLSTDQTFIKYIGSEHSNVAVLAEEHDNGFTLLSYSEVAGTSVGSVTYKTKLIRTDLYGNVLWHRNFPEFTENPNDVEESMKPSSFIKINSGYLILGDRINGNTTTLQIVKVDLDGNNSTITTIPSDLNLQGKSILQDGPDHYAVLATVKDATSDEMFFARIQASDMSVQFSKRYGQGGSAVVGRLFRTAEPNYIWGGSVSLNNSPSSTFLVQVDAIGDGIFNHQINPDEVKLTTYDFCKTVGGWAITGALENENLNQDIFVQKISNLGVVVSLAFNKTKDFEELNDKGTSICSNEDGSLIVAGTVGTKERSDDLYISKFDGFGNTKWEYTYGNSDKQEAASVRSVSTGGYILFGTTYFGNVKKLILVRVNEEGKL